MKNNKIIEMAGLKVRITGIEIDRQFHNFASRGKPHFEVNCRNQAHKNLELRDFWDKLQEWQVSICRRNGTFEVKSISGKHIPIGTINLKTGQAGFNDYSEQLREILFPPFLRVCFQLFLTKFRGFSLHACGIIRDEKGYLFIGASGSGKTTVAGLRPADAVLLSDEYICLKKKGRDFFMYSTPFRSAEKIFCRLNKIFFLNKAKQICFDKTSVSNSVLNLLPNVLYNTADPELMATVFNTAVELCAKTVSYRMSFPIDSLIWEKIRELDDA